jgi:hypothetical protein
MFLRNKKEDIFCFDLNNLRCFVKQQKEENLIKRRFKNFTLLLVKANDIKNLKKNLIVSNLK